MNAEEISMKAQQWRTCDIELTGTGKYNNPFQDVDVNAVFTGPKGETVNILGFWDGGDKWIVRFAPTRVGMWKYTITSTNPSDTGLSGAGEVECVPYDGELDMYKHGFLKVGPQARYLCHDDGKPFFWLGDTHWTFITEEKFYESNCPKYESQFKACVDKRIEQGFTAYVCNFRDGVNFNAFGRYDQFLVESEYGLVPDIEFFKSNPDPKMQYLADVGLAIAVGYSWGGAIMTGGIERYKLLAKYLAARYGAYPVIWTLAGELPGYDKKTMQPMIDAWREVALECEKWAAYNNLQTVHLGTDRPFPDIYQGESWYDFALSQAGHGDFTMYYDQYTGYREAFPRCPLVEGEGFYEGINTNELVSRPVTASMFRRLAYLCFQGGGCGYTYGVNGVWELQWESGKGGIGWGDIAWWEGLELPGANQLTTMRKFYEEVEWHTLRPISFAVDTGRDSGIEQIELAGHASFTANDDMSTVVGYFPESAFPIATIHTLVAESYTARWFYPDEGEYELIDADVRPNGGVWKIPFAGNTFMNRRDKLLVLTAN